MNDTAIEVTGEKVDVIHADRRTGDPAVLVADASMAEQGLGRKPKFTKLE